MTRDEILARYRQHRETCKAVHLSAFKNVSSAGLLDAAKRLGLSDGKMVLAEDEAQLVLVSDLALYTAMPGRSRAIERYARTCLGEEARMAETLCKARFSIFRVMRKDEVAGLWLRDVLREEDIWLMDESLEAHAQPDMVFATRVAKPDAFFINCGEVVSLQPDAIAEMLDHFDDMNISADPVTLAEDRRFATAIYRMTLAAGFTYGGGQGTSL